MVINNLSDDAGAGGVKPVNYRHHQTWNAGSKFKDHGTAGVVQSSVEDDSDWAAAERRLLRASDDASATSPVSVDTLVHSAPKSLTRRWSNS